MEKMAQVMNKFGEKLSVPSEQISIRLPQLEQKCWPWGFQIEVENS